MKTKLIVSLLIGSIFAATNAFAGEASGGKAGSVRCESEVVYTECATAESGFSDPAGATEACLEKAKEGADFIVGYIGDTYDVQAWVSGSESSVDCEGWVCTATCCIEVSACQGQV